jgi:hypothetical protein
LLNLIHPPVLPSVAKRSDIFISCFFSMSIME